MNSPQDSATITLTVNGKECCVKPKSHSSLLAYLRTELQLTGTKQGCASGQCGACNVLMDDVAMQSCQVSLAAADQCNIVTVESIVHSPLGARIADTLTRHDAAQCGYCLPGIVVAAYADLLTSTNPDPVYALRRNLCRCGSHTRILNALQEVIDTPDTSA